eukprot:530508-Prorocentrum_minimum.AAC.3
MKKARYCIARASQSIRVSVHANKSVLEGSTDCEPPALRIPPNVSHTKCGEIQPSQEFRRVPESSTPTPTPTIAQPAFPFTQPRDRARTHLMTGGIPCRSAQQLMKVKAKSKAHML